MPISSVSSPSRPGSHSNSALRYRAQAPLVDQLLREIGIEGGDIQRLVGDASGAHAALPSATPKE